MIFTKLAAALVAVAPVALAAPATNTIARRTTGSMTFYDPSGAVGACGETSSPDELIAAVSAEMLNNKEACGNSITITGDAGETTVTVVDLCPGCGPNDVDLSPAAFEAAIGPQSVGRADAEWEWA